MPGGTPRIDIGAALSRAHLPWVDQVPRWDAFKAAHPEVVITPPGKTAGALWRAVIPLPDGEDIVTRYELGDLLDVLEEHFPPPPP